MKTIHNSIKIECHTGFASKRLQRKLANKWFTLATQLEGSCLILNAPSYVLRYVKKQPEFASFSNLFSVSIQT